MAEPIRQIDPRAAGVVAAGVLRIGLFPSFFYARTPGSGELTGWGIEMARLLASRLGVPLALVERPSPPAIVASLRAGECDAAFIGISAERAAEVDFSEPWVAAEFTYLVPTGVPVAAIPDADRPGVRIAVVRNHAMDAALRGKLHAAEPVYADTPDAAFALLLAGHATVLAGIRPGLAGYAARLPGARVLPDRYGANVIGMAVRKGEPDWHACVSDFVAGTKAGGAARDAARRVGAVGLEVVA